MKKIAKILTLSLSIMFLQGCSNESTKPKEFIEVTDGLNQELHNSILDLEQGRSKDIENVFVYKAPDVMPRVDNNLNFYDVYSRRLSWISMWEYDSEVKKDNNGNIIEVTIRNDSKPFREATYTLSKDVKGETYVLLMSLSDVDDYDMNLFNMNINWVSNIARTAFGKYDYTTINDEIRKAVDTGISTAIIIDYGYDNYVGNVSEMFLVNNKKILYLVAYNNKNYIL